MADYTKEELSPLFVLRSEGGNHGGWDDGVSDGDRNSDSGSNSNRGSDGDRNSDSGGESDSVRNEDDEEE